MLSQFVTSVLRKQVFYQPSYLQILFPKSQLRSAIITLAFKDLNSLTVAQPRPEAPPVTSATKFSSIFIIQKVSKIYHAFLMLHNYSTFQLHVFQISLGISLSNRLSLRWARGISSVASSDFVLKNGKYKIDQTIKLQIRADIQKEQSSLLSVQQIKGDQKSTIGLVRISLAQEFSKKRVKLQRCEYVQAWIELSLVKFKKVGQICKTDSVVMNAAGKLLNTVQRFEYLADLIEQSNQIKQSQPAFQVNQKAHLQSVIQSQSKKLGDLLNLLSEIGNKRILQQVNKLLMT